MKRRVKNTLFTILLLTLTASVVLLIYLNLFASGDRNLTGEWRWELDMTKEAAASALCWLQDMEAVTVSLEEMESCMGELTIQVSLALEQTAHSEGNFRCNVLPESYDACNQAAYEAFAAAFRELLAERLRMAGYEGGTDETAVEALVTETFGMSTVSYLMACGPALLPPLEELQAQYDGSGVYEAAEGVLTREYDAGLPMGTRAESYFREGASLILTGEVSLDSLSPFSDDYPVIFTLERTGNE